MYVGADPPLYKIQRQHLQYIMLKELSVFSGMVNTVWSFMSDSKRQHEREGLLSRLMKAGAEERGSF